MTTDRNDSGRATGDSLEGAASARRRLLRGSFAVPTVLTLTSGSAIAASSSLRCFANSPSGVDAPPDNYFRVQRYLGRISNTNNIPMVRGIDIAERAAIEGFLVGSYGGTTSNVNWIRLDTGALGVNPSGNPDVDTGKFAALRLTHTGGTDAAPVFTVTGLSRSSQDFVGSGNVMTGSCWASI